MKYCHRSRNKRVRSALLCSFWRSACLIRAKNSATRNLGNVRANFTLFIKSRILLVLELTVATPEAPAGRHDFFGRPLPADACP